MANEYDNNPGNFIDYTVKLIALRVSDEYKMIGHEELRTKVYIMSADNKNEIMVGEYAASEMIGLPYNMYSDEMTDRLIKEIIRSTVAKHIHPLAIVVSVEGKGIEIDLRSKMDVNVSKSNVIYGVTIDKHKSVVIMKVNDNGDTDEIDWITHDRQEELSTIDIKTVSSFADHIMSQLQGAAREIKDKSDYQDGYVDLLKVPYGKFPAWRYN